MMDKKKILVVDDEPIFLQAITVSLKEHNYQVIKATNGKEALEKLSTEKPDAVLLDIVMPELDGLKTLERVRKNNKSLPIFITTASSNEERFKRARELGASGFIVKSSDLSKAVRNIRNALRLADRYRAQK